MSYWETTKWEKGKETIEKEGLGLGCVTFECEAILTFLSYDLFELCQY